MAFYSSDSLVLLLLSFFFLFFFFNDTATTEIYTLSLHDALPIFALPRPVWRFAVAGACAAALMVASLDRKSTRLNSSHQIISYAVFCLKKKKKYIKQQHTIFIQLQHYILHHVSQNL